VIHPSIDGCISLRAAHGLRPEDVTRVDLRVHPLVLELTGKASPRTGLESKFSVYHACAAGLVFGRAGEPEFSDQAVADPRVLGLRGRVHAVADRDIDEASADVTVTTATGKAHHVFVERAIGSLERPMTDADLAGKFHGLVDPILGMATADRLIGMVMEIGSAADVRRLTACAATAAPARTTGA
jgi:2-methylcitrate dehydratase PrpD